MNLNEEASKIAHLYQKFSEIYIQIGNIEKAEKMNIKALHFSENQFENCDFNLTGQYNNIAVQNEKIGNFKKAEEFYLKTEKSQGNYLNWKKKQIGYQIYFIENQEIFYRKIGKVAKANQLREKIMQLRSYFAG